MQLAVQCHKTAAEVYDPILLLIMLISMPMLIVMVLDGGADMDAVHCDAASWVPKYPCSNSYA